MATLLAFARVIHVLWSNRKAEAALVASAVTLATEVYSALHH
jgi:hypothetical protein